MRTRAPPWNRKGDIYVGTEQSWAFSISGAGESAWRPPVLSEEH